MLDVVKTLLTVSTGWSGATESSAGDESVGAPGAADGPPGIAPPHESSSIAAAAGARHLQPLGGRHAASNIVAGVKIILRPVGGSDYRCSLPPPIGTMDYYGSLQAALTAFIQGELASQAGSVSESRSAGEASQFEYPLPAKSQSSNPIQSVSWEPLRERTEDE